MGIPSKNNRESKDFGLSNEAFTNYRHSIAEIAVGDSRE